MSKMHVVDTDTGKLVPLGGPGGAIPVTGVVGGGGGGGDASAANQSTQIALETAIRDRLPATPHTQPLTDAQIRATPVQSYPVERDTSGNPMPLGKPVAYVNRADGQPTTATVTDGVDTWVFTWTYDASGFVTAESGWVKQ